jgi:phosphoribosylaminoimidazole (AIR) synthetase
MVVVASAEDAPAIAEAFQREGETVFMLGEVVADKTQKVKIG